MLGGVQQLVVGERWSQPEWPEMQAETQRDQGPHASVSRGGGSVSINAAASQGRGEPRNGHWTWHDGVEWLQGRTGEGRGGDGTQLGRTKVGRAVRKQRWSRDAPRRAMGPREG